MFDFNRICGWRIEDAVCIADPWHDEPSHQVVSVHELEASS